MMDLVSLANDQLSLPNPMLLGWMKFGAQAIYVVVYFGITWKLLSVAQTKIENRHKKDEVKEMESHD